MYFDDKFTKRKAKYRKNYDIDEKLYSQLSEYTKVYNASIADLLNACIEHLIETEDIRVHKKSGEELYISHTFYVREENIKGLEKLKDKYGISIYRLVNMSIRNVICQ